MGESCDIHSEEDKAVPEKNKKRRLKTPFQVEALEKFYNEHKYPTESMKLQLAEEIGLSEKQVSGWFCHRRLKDKKLSKDEAYASARQDLSSGVIQDRGSGHRQDSCSSTKQGEHKHFDPKEVESRRLYGQEYPSGDMILMSRGQYIHTGNYNAMENSSSGSSSASQDRLFAQSEDPYGMESLRYSSQNGSYLLMNSKGIKNRGHMMSSGYLNVQDEVENAAITAVKRQLGRHYREDGPPLGVEFQPLPPGAFDSPVTNPNHEPYYVGDPIVQSSHSIPSVCKDPTLGTRYDRYHSMMHTQGSYPEGAHLRRTMLDHRDEFSSFPSKRKSSFTSCSNRAPDKNSMYMNGDSIEETSMLSISRNCGARSKHSVQGIRSDALANDLPHVYGGKLIANEPFYPQLHKCDDSTNPHLFQRNDYIGSKSSNLVLTHSGSLDTEERGKSGRMAKAEKLYRGRTSKEYANPVKVRMQPENEIRIGRRMRGHELIPRDYASKTPSPQELLSWTNHMKGSAVEMPTSFSEDETAATSSSMD